MSARLNHQFSHNTTNKKEVIREEAYGEEDKVPPHYFVFLSFPYAALSLPSVLCPFQSFNNRWTMTKRRWVEVFERAVRLKWWEVGCFCSLTLKGGRRERVWNANISEVSALTKWLISINKNIDLGPTKVSNCLEQLCLSREQPKMGNISRDQPCNSRY